MEDNTDRKLRRLWLKLLSRCVFRQMGEDLPLTASGVGLDVHCLLHRQVLFFMSDESMLVVPPPGSSDEFPSPGFEAGFEAVDGLAR